VRIPPELPFPPRVGLQPSVLWADNHSDSFHYHFGEYFTSVLCSSPQALGESVRATNQIRTAVYTVSWRWGESESMSKSNVRGITATRSLYMSHG